VFAGRNSHQSYFRETVVSDGHYRRVGAGYSIPGFIHRRSAETIAQQPRAFKIEIARGDNRGTQFFYCGSPFHSD
jgi:hypothetical protein